MMPLCFFLITWLVERKFEATEASERLIDADGLAVVNGLIRASHGKQSLAVPGTELNPSATGMKDRTTCGW